MFAGRLSDKVSSELGYYGRAFVFPAEGGQEMNETEVTLISLKEEDREQFITDNQWAFKYGSTIESGMRNDEYEEGDKIISRKTIEHSIDHGEAYRIISDGKKVGGIIVSVDGNRGDLEILFVNPECHSKGIGQAAWFEMEKLHPEVKVWETLTPYFETRNIHFYVNKLGFHIVEFFNPFHPEPDSPYDGSRDEEMGEDQSGREELDFRFEKRIS